MKLNALALAVLLTIRAAPLAAQTVTATYDIPAAVAPNPPITLAQAQTWSGVLYVNNMPFASPHTCTQVGAVITCTFTVLDVKPGITATGLQTFQVALSAPILGEAGRSLPFTLPKASVPINLRLQ